MEQNVEKSVKARVNWVLHSGRVKWEETSWKKNRIIVLFSSISFHEWILLIRYFLEYGRSA